MCSFNFNLVFHILLLLILKSKSQDVEDSTVKAVLEDTFHKGQIQFKAGNVIININNTGSLNFYFENSPNGTDEHFLDEIVTNEKCPKAVRSRLCEEDGMSCRQDSDCSQGEVCCLVNNIHFRSCCVNPRSIVNKKPLPCLDTSSACTNVTKSCDEDPCNFFHMCCLSGTQYKCCNLMPF